MPGGAAGFATSTSAAKNKNKNERCPHLCTNLREGAKAAGFGAHSDGAHGKINTGLLPFTHSRLSGAKEHRRRCNLIKAGTLRIAGLRAGSPLPAGWRLENPSATAERYLEKNNNKKKTATTTARKTNTNEGDCTDADFY